MEGNKRRQIVVCACVCRGFILFWDIKCTKDEGSVSTEGRSTVGWPGLWVRLVEDIMQCFEGEGLVSHGTTHGETSYCSIFMTILSSS